MDDPTDDVRAGLPRLPRARRNRLEEQAHVRDVLLALGGSPEEFDRAHDPSANEANLGSRIAAYSRIATAAKPVAETMVEEPPPPPPPAATPLEVVRPEPARRPERPPRAKRRRAAGRQVRHVVVAVARAPWALVQGLVRAALAFVRALLRPAAALVRVVLRAVRDLRLALLRTAALLRGLLSRVVDVVRLLARVVVGAARELRLALPRATAVLRRSLRPIVRAVRMVGRVGSTAALTRPRRVGRSKGRGEATRVAEAVLTWVQPRPEPSDEPPATVESHADVSTAGNEANVRRVEVRPPVDRSDRTRRAPAGGLAVVAAFVVAGLVAGALVLTRHDGGGGQTQGGSSPAVGSPPPVPARAEFSDPRKYAAAMTRLALVSGRTEVDGSPACAQNSTFDRWTCRARGKPTLGAYAGVWLMYRCSPSSMPQPGGRPASVMINCTPQKPPATTA